MLRETLIHSEIYTEEYLKAKLQLCSYTNYKLHRVGVQWPGESDQRPIQLEFFLDKGLKFFMVVQEGGWNGACDKVER